MPGCRRKIFSRVLVYRSALNGSIPGTEENPLCGIRCRSWLASAITGSVRALERHQRRALAVCGPSLGLPPGRGSAWGCSAFRSIQRRCVREKDRHMEVISPRRARRMPRGLPRKRLRPGAASRPGDPAGPWHLSSWSSSKHGRGETARGTEHHHFQPCPQQPSWATSGWRSLEAPHPSAAEAGAARGTVQEEAWPGAACAHVEAKRRARGATQSWTHCPPQLCPTAHDKGRWLLQQVTVLRPRMLQQLHTPPQNPFSTPLPMLPAQAVSSSGQQGPKPQSCT